MVAAWIHPRRLPSRGAMRIYKALTFLVAAFVVTATLTTASAGDGARRCHHAKPNCKAGQNAICWCSSETSPDTQCRWMCGVDGGDDASRKGR